MPSVRLISSSLLIAEKRSSLLCQFMVISRPLSPATKAPDYYALCVSVCVCARERGESVCTYTCLHVKPGSTSTGHSVLLFPHRCLKCSISPRDAFILFIFFVVWAEYVTELRSWNPPYTGHLISVANISFWFVSPHSSLCAVRRDKIPGKQSRSRSIRIVSPQQWRLDRRTGVEADKCGILNRVKVFQLRPFGGGCPALKR